MLFIRGQVFAGEFRGGQQHGLGERSSHERRARYRGEFARGMPHGCGVEGEGPGSELYLGQFVQGARHGLALVREGGKRRFELERWEDGVRVCGSHELAQLFVGGLPEAATVAPPPLPTVPPTACPTGA